jgi:hypothetical protein
VKNRRGCTGVSQEEENVRDIAFIFLLICVGPNFPFSTASVILEIEKKNRATPEDRQ